MRYSLAAITADDIRGLKEQFPGVPVVTYVNTSAAIDLPIGHKDEAWSFDHFDTMTVMVPDAPRPNEIVLCMGVADGGRPHPRVGSKPITD